jgi:hypothetical protein
VDIVRKIFSMLPHYKYASIITILHNKEDLNKMTQHFSSASQWHLKCHGRWVKKKLLHQAKSITLTCDKQKKVKGKKQVGTS